MSKCEAELNKIRLELYEETKHMTNEEHTRWSNERGQKLAAQYGFNIQAVAEAKVAYAVGSQA